MLKKILWITSALLGLLMVIFMLGPDASSKELDWSVYPDIPKLSEIEVHIDADNDHPLLRPGNGAEIAWADSLRQTEYSIVYLHGFSASEQEGDPIHRKLAAEIGANLYLTRIPGHGTSDIDAFQNIQAQQWLDYARRAVAIGKAIGQKVLLMSTSTGSTLSIALASVDPAVHALILLSPNIRIYDPSAVWLTRPWGKQIGAAVMGSEYRTWEAPDSASKYWSTTYHIDGLIALQDLLDKTMHKEVFQQIKCPVYLAYYYKDEQHQDDVVSVAAMQEFMEQISTPPSMKKSEAFPNAGYHVIGSRHWNPNWLEVYQGIRQFTLEVLKIQ